MFVSPFTVSLGCDAAIVVVYWQDSARFGGTPWFGILDGRDYTDEMVDVTWLAILRVAFLLPQVLPFLKRRRLSCPGFHQAFVAANAVLIVAKAIALLVAGVSERTAFFWWLLLVLSAASIIAQRACLRHLRSSMPTPRLYDAHFLSRKILNPPKYGTDKMHRLSLTALQDRYKTIFIGSRLNARLLEEPYGSDYSDSDRDAGSDLEAVGRDGEDDDDEEKGYWPGGGGRASSSSNKVRRERSKRRRHRTAATRSRQESTADLVYLFAERMQEARDAWSARVQNLQKRWQASFLRGDWGVRGSSLSGDRDAALRLTFGLIVRMYAYEDALDDLRMVAEQDPSCLEPFAPQFVSFLIWDSYYMSGQLEEWLLARCSENLYFAHALEFQLRASCLPAAAPGAGAGGAENSAAGSSSPGRSAVSTRGSGDLTAGSVGNGGSGTSGGGDSDGSSGDVIDKFGRRAVELLLMDIAEKGEHAACHLVEAGRTLSVEMETAGATAAAGGEGGDLGLLESSSLVHPGGGASSSARVTAAGAAEQILSASGGGGEGVGEGESRVSLYRQTLDFLGRLSEMASSLTPLSKAKRTPRLKEQLVEVGRDFFGAAAGADGGGGRLVYVPLGDRHHRVVAVHPSESFAFSTRERAPCFICLEVVSAREPMAPRRRSRSSSIGVGLGRRDSLDDVQGEDQRGGLLGGRARALRQWLPKFRFPGVREWSLSVEDKEEDDERDDVVEYGGGEVGEEGDGRQGDSAGAAVAEGGSGGLRDKRKRRSTGGGGEGGQREDDRYYRLLAEEGGEGTGATGTAAMVSPRGGSGALSELPEWWADSSRSDGVWGGGAGDGDASVGGGDDSAAALDDAPRQRWLPTPSSEPTTTAGGALLVRPPLVGSGSSAVWAAEVGEQRVVVKCDDCGAASGVSCRSGCRSKEMRSAVAAVAVAGKEGNEEGRGAIGETLGSEEEQERARATAQPQVLFNELWHDKSNRIRSVSPWTDEPGWRLLPVIVKANDDLRQEQLASQLLFTMQRILRAEGVRVWLRPYDIVALSVDTGIIEAVPDTISLDALRRYRGRAVGGGNTAGSGDSATSRFSLVGFFEARFGPKVSDGFKKAQRRFIESLAAYSIACYILQIKDRHNGNILLDAMGRVIHVDFGFILANSPGGNLGFEQAPFKLTKSFLDVMGGTRSRCFRDFLELCVETFLALRRSSQEIVLLVEMMASGNATLPCFQGPGGGAAAAADLAARFQPELNDHACKDFVHKLVQQSTGSWTTTWYDKYQRLWSGIY